jgi:serine protease Do
MWLVATGVVVAAFALVGNARRPRAPAEIPVKVARPAAVAAPAPAAPAEQKPLTTEEIAASALPSVVGIRCGGQAGAGFFVGEDLIVTNAHVTCEGKEIVTVLLQDGREILGKVKTRDAWVDIATVEVIASNVTPLRVGDPLALKPGARLAVMGSPKGLDFTVHEGNVSYVGRNLHGVGYLQFSAAVNPGNSGGPILDKTGAAVGIVTLKRMDAEGIAFALPLWYARPPGTAEAQGRWTAFLDKIRDEDAQERRKMVASLERPLLLSLRTGQNGEIGALLAQMRAERPLGGRIELQVTQGTSGCLARGMVSKWLPLDEILKNAGETPREAEWLLRSGDAKNLYYTVADMDFTGCQLGDAPAQVSFDGGKPLVVPGTKLTTAATASRRAREVQQASASLVDSVNDVRAEQWRASFRNARARVDAASAILADARSRASQAGTGSAAQWQARAAAAEAVLHAAESDLADLERRASNEAVPREWRR